jgi:hypothetical protein
VRILTKEETRSAFLKEKEIISKTECFLTFSIFCIMVLVTTINQN